MSNKEDLYIHVYTGIGSETMAYRNPDETWETGSALLEFIYADLFRSRVWKIRFGRYGISQRAPSLFQTYFPGKFHQLF